MEKSTSIADYFSNRGTMPVCVPPTCLRGRQDPETGNLDGSKGVEDLIRFLEVPNASKCPGGIGLPALVRPLKILPTHVEIIFCGVGALYFKVEF